MTRALLRLKLGTWVVGVSCLLSALPVATSLAEDAPGGDPAAEVSDSDQSPTFSRRDALIASLAIFVLAVFVGFEVITKVPPTLHTPLMSGSNAISGVTIVGAIIVAGVKLGPVSVLGLIAVILAAINVVGGFLVTHRMLAMFQKRK